jgi:uncharacterized protein (TIGR03437 family)
MSKSIRIGVFSALVAFVALGQTFNELNGHLFSNWDVSVPDLQMQPGDWIRYSRALPGRLVMVVFHVGPPFHTTVLQSVDYRHFEVILDDATALDGDKINFSGKSGAFTGVFFGKLVAEVDGIYLTGQCQQTLPNLPPFVVDCSAWKIPYDGTSPRKLLALGTTQAKLASGKTITGTVASFTNAYPSLDGKKIQIFAIVQIPGPIPNSIFPYNGIFEVADDGSLTETVAFPTMGPFFDDYVGIWETSKGLTYATRVGDLGDSLFFQDFSSGTVTPFFQIGQLFLGEYPHYLASVDADWKTYNLVVTYQVIGLSERYHIVSFDAGTQKPKVIWDGSTIPGVGDPQYPVDVAFSEGNVGAVRFVMAPAAVATANDIVVTVWDGNSLSLLMKPGDVIGGNTIQQVFSGYSHNTVAYLGCTGWISTFADDGTLDQMLIHYQPCIQSAQVASDAITLTGDNLQLPGYDPQVTVGGVGAKVVSATQTQVVVSLDGVPGGKESVVLALAGRIVSNATSIVLPGSAIPTPTISAVVNAASFKTEPLSSGSWFSIFGTNLGDKASWNGDLKTFSLGGASVTVCGFAATMSLNSGSMSGGGQINAVVPNDVTGKSSCPVIVTVNGESSQPVNVEIQEGIMELFTFSSSAGVLPVVTHANANPVGPASAGLQPAKEGETVIAWGTGDCRTPKILIGGTAATVPFAGSTGIGLCQFNIVVPESIATVTGEVTMALSTSPTSYQLAVSK